MELSQTLRKVCVFFLFFSLGGRGISFCLIEFVSLPECVKVRVDDTTERFTEWRHYRTDCNMFCLLDLCVWGWGWGGLKIGCVSVCVPAQVYKGQLIPIASKQIVCLCVFVCVRACVSVCICLFVLGSRLVDPGPGQWV